VADGPAAPWVAAYVETPAQLRLPAEVRDRVTQSLRLAEQLGAETYMLPGPKMSEAILAFAHDRNVTKIVVGKPRRQLWTRILIGSIVDALDFLFVPPVFTFAVSDVRYLFTFAVMLLVGLVTSSLAARIRTQADTARLREQRTAALYAMSRELAGTRGVDQLLTIAVRHISEVFRSQVVVLLPGPGGTLVPTGGGQ